MGQYLPQQQQQQQQQQLLYNTQNNNTVFNEYAVRGVLVRSIAVFERAHVYVCVLYVV